MLGPWSYIEMSVSFNNTSQVTLAVIVSDGSVTLRTPELETSGAQGQLTCSHLNSLREPEPTANPNTQAPTLGLRQVSGRTQSLGLLRPKVRTQTFERPKNAYWD